MVTWQAAAFAAIVSLPVVSPGQELKDGDERLTDEIVVVGRAVKTSSTRIEVERQMLVDSSTALKNIPGANVNSNGMITGIAQYRGMYGDRVAVDIDNQAMISGGPNAMDAPLSYTSPLITQDLVVERGIASISSAPESIGGYLNARLERGDFSDGNARVSGMFGTRYFSNGNITTSAARLTLADRHHRFSIISEFDEGNDIATPAGVIRPSSLNRERYDVSYAFNSSDAAFLLFAGRLDTTDSGTPALAMDIRYIETDMYGLQFNVNLTDTFGIEGRFAYNDVDHLMDNFSLRSPPQPMRSRQNATRGSGSQFQLAGLLGLGNGVLRIGADGIMAEHESVITNPAMAMFQVDNFKDVQRDVHGVFAEWTGDFESSGIEIGLRYKQVRTVAGLARVMGMPEPMATSAGLLANTFNTADRDLGWNTIDAVAKYHYRVSDSTEWVLEAGTKTRAPSYQELYLWLPLEITGGLADGRTYIGNLDLEEERSNEIAVGFTSQTGRFSLSPQIYYRNVDNYIQGIPSTNMLGNTLSIMMSGAPALQFSNVDAEIWGGDIAWKLDLNDSWFLDGIAAYSRGARTDVNDDLYRLAPFNSSVGLTYASDSWSIEPELIIYSKQDKVSGYNSELPTSGYEIVNVTFTWAASESLRIEARIDNLLDETFQDHLAGVNRAMGSDIPVGERLYGAERSFSAGLIYRFGD